MKILVVCQYYYPEPFRISDICEELVRKGHEVQVVTGYPNYPEGILYKGYGRKKKIDEVINGVKVHRCFTIPRKKGSIYRLFNYVSFAFSSKIYVKSKKCVAADEKNFDVVFVNQLSPVIMGEAAISYKKKYKVPIILYCLDLWPESLIAGGVKRNSFVYKIFRKWSERIYCNVDKIAVTSRMFIEYLVKEFGISIDRIYYLPQYAEGIFEKIPQKEANGLFDFMFAGNIGEIQSVETIIKAARLLKNEPVKFHIVGGGTDLERLQILSTKNGLDNVIFYGRRPVEEMPMFYEKADAMLVTLKADPILSFTLPGKIQSYMAAGKPIIGAIDGEAAVVIKEADCGFCGNAENEEILANNIRLFIKNNNAKKQGENAISYYNKYFVKTNFIEQLIQVMN